MLGGLSVQPSGTALMLLSKKRRKGTKGVTVQHLGRWEGRKKKAQRGKAGVGRGERSIKNGQLQIEVTKNKL